MINVDEQTISNTNRSKNQWTDIRYNISKEKARITGEYPICRRSEIPENNKISGGDESIIIPVGDRSYNETTSTT